MEAADSLCCQPVASSRPYLLAPGIRVLCQRVYIIQLLGRVTPFWPGNIPSIHIFVIRCEVIRCWILRGTLAILHPSWKQRTQGKLSLMLHHCGLGIGWRQTRHPGPDSPSEFKMQNHLKSGWTNFFFFFFLWRERFFFPFPPITLLRSVSFVYLLHFTKYHLKGHVGFMSTTCINIRLTASVRG